MAQRNSGYEPVANDLYETPEWVTLLALRNLPIGRGVVEPACGTGKMARVIREDGRDVYASDIADHGYRCQDCQADFLQMDFLPVWCTDIVTNPPFGIQNRLAVKFIEHALELTRPIKGRVAMLLTADFDHAKGRRHLFADHPAFAARLAIQTRIRWIENSVGSPSQNHCWFFWDWNHTGPAVSIYAMQEAA
jgi:predicted RNA methylase